jgi:hypothetical protein
VINLLAEGTQHALINAMVATLLACGVILRWFSRRLGHARPVE